MKAGMEEQHGERAGPNSDMRDAPEAIVAKPVHAHALADRQKGDDRRKPQQREAGDLLPDPVDPEAIEADATLEARRIGPRRQQHAAIASTAASSETTTIVRAPNTGGCIGLAAEHFLQQRPA